MNRPWTAGLGLVGVLVCTIGVTVAIGSTAIGWGDVYRVLGHHLVGIGGPVDPIVDRIVWHLRLPRALLACLVGGGLSIIGVAMQTLVRNPLAEPYILGISSGASAGASFFYLGFLPPLLSKPLTMPLAAFLGGLASIAIVYLVARDGPRVSVARLLLAGVAMSALMASLTSFVTFSSPEPDKLRAVLFWLLGSLNGTRWEQLPLPALATTVGLGTMLLLARPLDAMLVGEEPAQSLGMPVEALKRGLIVLAAFVTGTLVAVSGAIGFVGLIVPHAVRLMVGVPHRRLVPLSFLGGAIFLCWADLAARTILPAQELPVGVLTALCGVPFFLILLRRRNYHFG
ncbi:ABC transporter permease [Salinibacter sp. 10B]|uniref:FecCD family ABC transporter permease n=1 Tax=Salinibacter sp. 10B TaxID=1923971 RepID=UPI000D29D18F|nr:iron ABC transporter permease [Salinibacter sp. 10B]PQJ35860.1 ABC transporter permease [Salinibacter sp. 10B]